MDCVLWAVGVVQRRGLARNVVPNTGGCHCVMAVGLAAGRQWLAAALGAAGRQAPVCRLWSSSLLSSRA